MRYQSYVPPGLWERTRWIRIAFVAGLGIGLLLGWFFHGIISFFVQFGLVALLLLPLLIIGYLWWRSSRRPRAGSGPVTVMTWSNDFPGRPPGARPGDVEDVPFTTSERRPPPPTAAYDVDAELDALRAERDRAEREGRR
jgi:hypothetical protein